MAYYVDTKSDFKPFDFKSSESVRKQFQSRFEEAKNAASREPQHALELAQKALNLVTGNDDLLNEKGEALLFLAAKLYVPLCNFSQSIAHLQEALEVFRRAGNKIGVAESFNNLGIVYSILTDHQAALQNFQESVIIYREIGDKKGFATTLKNFGIVCAELSDYESALRYYEQCLEIFLAIGEKKAAADTLTCMGIAFGYQKNCETSLVKLFQALEIRKDIGDAVGLANCLNNIATTYWFKEDHKQAAHYFRKSLKILKDVDNELMTINSMNGLAGTLSKLGDFTTAETLLKKTLEKSDALGLKNEKSYALRELAEVYAKTGKFQQAYQVQVAFQEVREATIGEEKQKQLSMLQVRFETEKSQKEAELQRLKNVELAGALADAETQRQRAEEASRVKSELLAIAAHDLKNPLQSIMGFSQLIGLKSNDAEKVRGYASTIERGAGRMLNIINDLLKSMRYELSTIELHKQRYDVGDILRMVVQNNLAQMEQKEQPLQIDLSTNCIADIDVSRMQEVFDNLVSNAVKYTPKGKRLTISLAKTETGRLLVAVRDEGQGLSEDDKSKLFGRFQRLSAQPTGGESSTGLGLSIVKQIVELHGGKVWAESKGVGKGATFFVELPIVE
jgi:signal transduction histidine kinase